jgi:acetylornithine deacetylase/succinyl-diaminopimelate desuccinylase-like protein
MDFATHPELLAARAAIRDADRDTFAEQVRIALTPAPPFAEEARARLLLERFREIGLDDVHQDGIGNVLGTIAGTDPDAAPVLAVAHLDSVFPAETPLELRHEGARVYCPGITDNARGLAAVLRLAEAMRASGLRTRRPLVFVGSVGEEGLGDLRGVKHLLREGSRWRGAHAFIAIDGCGVGRVINRAVGSRRLRVHLRGHGGHSWSDWGTPNPVHALGAAIAELGALSLPAHPRTTLTVARIGGGTSVNAIPEEAWMAIDLRSEGQAELLALESAVRAAAEAAARRAGGLAVEIEIIGDRPAGATPADSPLVEAALAATRAVGAHPELASSSTDANVPMSLGIPAITVGAGGESGGVHTVEEWYANTDGARGIERALLTLVAAGRGEA